MENVCAPRLGRARACLSSWQVNQKTTLPARHVDHVHLGEYKIWRSHSMDGQLERRCNLADHIPSGKGDRMAGEKMGYRTEMRR